ncbi:ATP-binding protein [Dactylosporangium fulvum]|uniref:histidine kinase n=1 Tax=Dactylosporangium fulvum TaxID=53359 RepID=A0ABY5W2W4_9ACTN|nr:ATP-binding protein [Dactylosporangium fulvum]UWP82406.1 ATP-binding protein [Dactylosporangium fulvum]
MTGKTRRFTIRARLAVAIAVLLAVIGALMLGVVYLFMRYVPLYSLTPMQGLEAPSSVPQATTHPSAVISNTDPAFAGPVISSTDDVFRLLLTASITAFVVLAVVGAIAGWVIAGRMLRPLQAINRVAKSAASGDLTQRVSGDGPHDELRDLAETLDDMLSRLERSVGEHQRFAANASHELRTPIATTQTLLDVALADPDLDLPALRRTAERIREINQRNRETIESLLTLADAEGGQLRQERVRLDALVHDALRAEESAAEALGLTVEAELVPATLTGDPALLRQAVANLVQNAVRHNVRDGRIRITVDRTSTDVCLIVENSGAALSEELVATLTEPFVRGHGRVAGPGRGHGLGLALARSVSEAHHARLVLQARDKGGLITEVRFPADDDGLA